VSERHAKGLAELQKYLDQLPAKIEANIMRGAMRQGANVIGAGAKDELASNGSVQSGILAAGIKTSTRNSKGVVYAYVKTTGKHAYVANWIEHGTAAHAIFPRGVGSLFFAGIFVDKINHPGSRPKPFMRPAMEKRAQAALIAVGERVRQKLTKAGIEGAADVEVESL
jgi:HK97 gp10 family phage protein